MTWPTGSRYIVLGMAFELPDLPYAYSALEPYIDELTMKIHHGKHHQAYVDNLNKALGGNSVLAAKSIEELLSDLDSVPAEIRQAVANHGGGHYNHTLFWRWLHPKPISRPEGKLEEAINSTFGSLDKFKEMFTEKAMSVFGSGWAFLIQTPDGKLQLKRHSFQNSPIMRGNKAILGIDVWEHAYYLKYQNRRKDYIDAWWNVVYWEKISVSFDR